MNLTFKELKCPHCEAPMQGAGGSFGGRITHVRVSCTECSQKLLIVPMRPDYEYNLTAATKEELTERDSKLSGLREEMKLIQQKIDVLHKLNNI